MTANRIRQPSTSQLSRWLIALGLGLFGLFAMAEQLPGTGQLAPAFQLDGPGGVEVSFPANADGKPVVLLFWASWCPYCRDLFPHLEAVRRDYESRGVSFYALNVWEDADPVAYFRERGYAMTLLLAADLVAEDYQVKGTPGVFAINGAQNIIYTRQRGEKPLEVEQSVRAALELALKTAAQ